MAFTSSGLKDSDIVFFDGACNLCNASVTFLIDIDRKKRLHFASLQSATAQSFLTLTESIDLLGEGASIILYTKGRIFRKSRAILEILRLVGLPWSLGYAGIVIPPFILDWLYDFVAKRRYRWFGKSDSCRVPTAELKERFLN
ncbi:PF04134 family protein [Leptospira broomii serovar Hurstbridge str. 5399]|uniref:PF04134 family protein n=1 Tax=Leptospira broomii serovar Hurstbridge str. 5399 TaxID=1049789 RepID=T0GDK0_9LEPT|nr:DCC1-like thiol-disulfide oxidoreductase family protein [Leptospira broomii]EQA44894.1 PF04134 family protein [Leptospira broomii serovar Hurstbridge str. 5399]